MKSFDKRDTKSITKKKHFNNECKYWRKLLRECDYNHSYSLCYFCLMVFARDNKERIIDFTQGFGPHIKAFYGNPVYVPVCFDCYNNIINDINIERVTSMNIEIKTTYEDSTHESATGHVLFADHLAFYVRRYEQALNLAEIAWRLERYKSSYDGNELTREQILNLIESGDYNYWKKLAKAI